METKKTKVKQMEACNRIEFKLRMGYKIPEDKEYIGVMMYRGDELVGVIEANPKEFQETLGQVTEAIEKIRDCSYPIMNADRVDYSYEKPLKERKEVVIPCNDKIEKALDNLKEALEAEGKSINDFEEAVRKELDRRVEVGELVKVGEAYQETDKTKNEGKDE